MQIIFAQLDRTCESICFFNTSGKTTQVWNIDIKDDHDQLISVVVRLLLNLFNNVTEHPDKIVEFTILSGIEDFLI